MMNTQNLDHEMMTQTTGCESSNDAFAQSLLLWVASFPLFVAGLALLGGSLNTVGYVLELAAAVCFFSPVTQLLGCLTERK